MISRSTLVGALVVAELAILGAAGQAVAGGSSAGPFGAHRHHFGHFGHVGVVATSDDAPDITSTLDKTFAGGGLTPHVIVDVSDVPISVQTGAAPSVHVAGTVEKSGYRNAADGDIVATATADGVRITAHETDSVPGDFTRTLRLTVPPGAQVEIASAGAIDAGGLRAKLIAHIHDGAIRVSNHRGDIDVATASGSIELVDVQGDAVAAHSTDGHVKLTTVGAEHLDVHTASGHIEATDLRAIDGAIATTDGHVTVTFAADSDASVSLHTDDGTITGAGSGPATSDSAESRTVRLGSARGNFAVSTANGSITISQGAKV